MNTPLKTQLTEAKLTLKGAKDMVASLRVLVKEEAAQISALKRVAVAAKKERVAKRKAEKLANANAKKIAREIKHAAKVAKTEARIAKAQAKLNALKARHATPKTIKAKNRKASKVTVFTAEQIAEMNAKAA